MDPAGDRLRGVARGAAGHPQRHAADAAGLPHAANAGGRGRLVERFVASEAETHTFSLRVRDDRQPELAGPRQRVLHPVPVQTAGVDAWLLPKEDAAMLLADLQRRSDYREHSSPHLLVNNGQSTVVSAMRGRAYVRDVILPGRKLAAASKPSRARSTRASRWSSARCCPPTAA